MTKYITKILGVAALSLTLGLGLGYSGIYKENRSIIKKCEAVLPRHQKCELLALPVPEEPHD